MPKLTLVQDRKTVQIYDLDQPVIRIGDLEIAEMSSAGRVPYL